MVANPTIPYDVTLYTPACWKASTPTNLVPCDDNFCCSTTVTMQTVDGWPQATNQTINYPTPTSCPGIVGPNCDYICDALPVPLNEPLIPWHFDYTFLCEPVCSGPLHLRGTYFTYYGDTVFVGYAARENCTEQPCSSLSSECNPNQFHRIQVLHIQIVHRDPLLTTRSTYEYVFHALKASIENYAEWIKNRTSFLCFKILVRQCWKTFGVNGPNDFLAYPCRPPTECCYRYMRILWDERDNCWKMGPNCPAVVDEPNDCPPTMSRCTYGCEWFYRCWDVDGDGEPDIWSYCDMLRYDYWGGCIRPRISEFETEDPNLPLQRNVNVHKENISDNLSFNIESTLSEQVTLQLFDALGYLVLAKQLSLEKGQNNINLSNMKLPNGLYFYNITLDNSVLLYGKFIYIK